jgi:hypothetical protein
MSKEKEIKKIETEIEEIISNLTKTYSSVLVDRLHELRVNLKAAKERDTHRMAVFQERIEVVR